MKTTANTITALKKDLTEIYYFYSLGCVWCKNTEPLIDELNKEGYNILKLDISNSENKKIYKELKEKYNNKCGIPWIINLSTGYDIAEFREKEIIEKLANGEKIVEAPKRSGSPPQLPHRNASSEDINLWKKEYDKWMEKNKHMTNFLSTKQILKKRQWPEPRPSLKGSMTGEDIIIYEKNCIKWKKENKHLFFPPYDC